MQMIRSIAFNIAMYIWMVIVGIACIPLLIASPEGARWTCTFYARTTMWLLAKMTGLRTEIRGTVPTGGTLVASKHQSFLDILLIWVPQKRPFFIMKSILRFAPIFGQYALRLGCIPVQRGKRAEAIKEMLRKVRSGKRAGGQLLIYPQGTRVAPGVRAPYKVGTFALYELLGQPCVPVATNVGVFWPKRGVLRKPGLAVAEFLEPIPPGLNRATFMATLEERVETASNRLMAEAGFVVLPETGSVSDLASASGRGVSPPSK